MKQQWSKRLRTLAFFTFLLAINSLQVFADVPPPPGGSGGSGPGGSDLPVGAPLTSGTRIMIFLGLSYIAILGLSRLLMKWKKQNIENN